MLPRSTHEHTGTLDGAGAGDHDRPFTFGKCPRALWPYPFNTLQYARLLLLRSRWQDGLVHEDDMTCGSGREFNASMATCDPSRTRP
jgi:hypothetical protein